MDDGPRLASQALHAQRQSLAAAVVERHYALHPELMVRYGAQGRQQCLQDACYHLDHLAAALAASRPEMFAEYTAWAKVLLAGRGLPVEDLVQHLRYLRCLVPQVLPAARSTLVCTYLDVGLAHLPQAPAVLPTWCPPEAALADLASAYLEALLAMERQTACQLIMEAVEAGSSIQDIYLHVLQRTQYEIGRLWQMNQLSVVHEHYSTAVTQHVMAQLYPYILSGTKTGRTLVMACVAGELHEVGARMVADFFELAGWNTVYVGANTPTASLLHLLVARPPQMLGIAATMPWHVPAVAELSAAVRASTVGQTVKILVGGYALTTAPELWRALGADGWARDAADAVAVAERLVPS